MSKGPPIYVEIRCKEKAILNVSLSLIEGFSYKIIAAAKELEEEIISWLLLYAEARPPPFSISYRNQMTPFQKKVLEEMGKIPFGEKLSYQELAIRCGVPRGARAVGGACGANPLPLFIPCHRILRQDGSIGGFSAGVEVKQRLLEFERRAVRDKSPAQIDAIISQPQMKRGTKRVLQKPQ